MNSTNRARLSAKIAASIAAILSGVACGGSVERAAAGDARDAGSGDAAWRGNDAGASAPHDAAPDVAVLAPPPERDEGCGFAIDGALRASLAGAASASPGGSEIPFLAVRCTASANGVAYEVLEQVIDGRVNGVYVTANGAEFSSSSPCVTDSTVGGDAAPSDAIGEHVRTSARCAALQSNASGGFVSLDVWIATVVTPRR